jgi:hypothetical protein
LRVIVPADAALPHPTLADPVAGEPDVVGVAGVDVVEGDVVEGGVDVVVEDALPEPDPHAARTREVTTKRVLTNHLKGRRGADVLAAISAATAVMASLRPCSLATAICAGR